MFTRRDFTWCGAGVGAALLGLGHRAGPLWARRLPTGAPALWLADRARCELVLCNGDALILRRVPLITPVALAADGAGGVWAVSALEGLPRGPHQLVHLDRDGVVVGREACRPLGLRKGPGALTVDAGARPVVVERVGGVARVALFDSGAEHTFSFDFEPACIAARGAWLWCVGVHGEVAARTAVEAARGMPHPGVVHAPRDRLPRGVEPLTIAPDDDGGGAWVLGRSLGGAALGRWHLAAPGTPRRVWLRTFDFAPGGLAATGQSEAWLADARLPRVIALTRDGRIRVWRRDLPGEGVEDALATADGGAWLAACGALLRVGPDGASRPGQGGFGHLVALASAAPFDVHVRSRELPAIRGP
jgi:hypothetical protein